MKVIVASKNPVKIQASLRGFEMMFPNEKHEVQGVSVSSGVDGQPRSDSETLQGALARAENASKEYPEADFWVGLEGGIEDRGADMISFAWVAVKSKDQIGKGKTGTFFLPPKVAELIRQGKELGEADDIVFGRTNSKQENGAVGLLTDNAIDRARFYSAAVILALIPFKNTNLWP